MSPHRESGISSIEIKVRNSYFPADGGGGGGNRTHQKFYLGALS